MRADSNSSRMALNESITVQPAFSHSLTTEQSQTLKFFQSLSAEQETDYAAKYADIEKLFQGILSDCKHWVQQLTRCYKRTWTICQVPSQISSQFAQELKVLFRGLNALGDGTVVDHDFEQQDWTTLVQALFDWGIIDADTLCQAVVTVHILCSTFVAELDTSVSASSVFGHYLEMKASTDGSHISSLSHSLFRREQYKYIGRKEFLEKEIRPIARRKTADLILKLFTLLDTCTKPNETGATEPCHISNDWNESFQEIKDDLAMRCTIQGNKPWKCFFNEIQSIHEQCLLMKCKMSIVNAKWRFKFHPIGSTFDSSEMVTESICRQRAIHGRVALGESPTIFVQRAMKPEEGKEPLFEDEILVAKAPVELWE